MEHRGKEEQELNKDRDYKRHVRQEIKGDMLCEGLCILECLYQG